VDWVEQSRLDVTWHFPDEPLSQVHLELEEAGGLTDVRLIHSDLGDLKASYLDGWCVHLC